MIIFILYRLTRLKSVSFISRKSLSIVSRINLYWPDEYASFKSFSFSVESKLAIWLSVTLERLFYGKLVKRFDQICSYFDYYLLNSCISISLLLLQELQAKSNWILNWNSLKKVIDKLYFKNTIGRSVCIKSLMRLKFCWCSVV